MSNGPRAPAFDVSASRGLARWLASNAASFALSSYQAGQLFLVGCRPDGSVSLNQQNFQRAMGLAWRSGRLHLASSFQLWRLENILRPGERANDAFDLLLVPRNAQTTGDIDIHELGVDQAHRTIFVNTSYSCLATPDIMHSFRPIWKPPFISKLAAEDRCHLNGLAMSEAGEACYVTAVSQSDIVDGWRQHRDSGGVLIDVADGRIVTDGMSMPHSPRIHEGSVYLLDSGRGFIIRVDPETGARKNVAFCPGFLRGMSIHNGHALVTVSRPRDESFNGLPLDAELKDRKAEPWCGVLIVDLATGDIVEWLKFNRGIDELFDVVVMPGFRCPMAVGPWSAEIQQTISFPQMVDQREPETL